MSPILDRHSLMHPFFYLCVRGHRGSSNAADAVANLPCPCSDLSLGLLPTAFLDLCLSIL